MKSTCGFECNVETGQGSVTANKDMSTDSENIHRDGAANRKRSCSLKTFVERHGAQTKASDGRINLPGTGICVKLDEAKAVNSLAKALSRGGAEHSSHDSFSEQFRTHWSG